MKTLRNIIRAGALSTIIFMTSCTSSESATVEEIIDESSDNQISNQEPEETPANPDIPSPADVAQESSATPTAVVDSGSLDSNSSTAIQDLPQDQQRVDAINQAEDNSQSGLTNQSAEQIVPEVPPPPSLSEIVGIQEPLGADNETPDALSPTSEPEAQHRSHHRVKGKVKKSKGGKVRHSAESHGPKASGNFKVYIVQPGDTLGTVARVVYGSSRRWNDIARANRLDHKTHIYPGDALRYTADEGSSSFEGEWESLPQSTVSVRKSDTLSSIAARVMGSSQYWKLLWRWNEGALSNPHRISPGIELRYVKPQDLTAFLTERKNRVPAH